MRDQNPELTKTHSAPSGVSVTGNGADSGTLRGRARRLVGSPVRVVTIARGDDGIHWFYEGTLSEVGEDYVAVTSRFDPRAETIVAFNGVAVIEPVPVGWPR